MQTTILLMNAKSCKGLTGVSKKKEGKWLNENFAYERSSRAHESSFVIIRERSLIKAVVLPKLGEKLMHPD